MTIRRIPDPLLPLLVGNMWIRLHPGPLLRLTDHAAISNRSLGKQANRVLKGQLLTDTGFCLLDQEFIPSI